MPWQEVSKMDQRGEFVALALVEGANRRALCRRFGIHPKTGYKWLARFAAGEGLDERSRRPQRSPRRTDAAMEARILSVRDAHPAWGARKIAHCLAREGLASPAVSVVHEILRRHGRIAPAHGAPARLRFETEAPNLLWQMDFKGWIRLGDGSRCHPLTVIDDHSRYAVVLAACGDETGATVRAHLERAFGRYGLPQALYVDNGTPWGDAAGARWTRFGVWLAKLGIGLIHARPCHPQSRGKNERFHRTLKAELFALRSFGDRAAVQQALDAWRETYNRERPHEALGQAVPASRYRLSPRALPAELPRVEYAPGETVRRVLAGKDYVAFRGRLWKVPRAFRGETVAIRPLSADGRFGVFFASHQIACIDLTRRSGDGHVSEQVTPISPV